MGGLELYKFTLVAITRCNLRCRLCCEYVPQHGAYPDMAVEECETLCRALFDTVDRVNTLHLSGGGEPFLHPRLDGLIDTCMEHSDRFGSLMLFTNCTIQPSRPLLDALARHKDKIVVQVSRYGLKQDREAAALAKLESTGASLKVENYFGDSQPFGGWLDFGEWGEHPRTDDELCRVFQGCAVTRDMRGNWRTRDGKVHWCSRSQRGMELGHVPDGPQDYVDLLDDSPVEAKRAKFRAIAAAKHLTACRHCSGDNGTMDPGRRHPAAEQL
jgi:hypothetical protein